MEFTGGIFRFKHHLARTSNNVGPCLKVPDDVRIKFIRILESQDELSQKKRRNILSIEKGVDNESLGIDNSSGRNLDRFVSKKGKVQSKTLNAMFKKEE